MAGEDLLEQGRKRRAQMLAFIVAYVDEHGYSPTMSEVGEAVGIVSPNAVRSHLYKLRDEGLIDITPRVSRSIVVKAS